MTKELQEMQHDTTFNQLNYNNTPGAIQTTQGIIS